MKTCEKQQPPCQALNHQEMAHGPGGGGGGGGGGKGGTHRCLEPSAEVERAALSHQCQSAATSQTKLQTAELDCPWPPETSPSVSAWRPEPRSMSSAPVPDLPVRAETCQRPIQTYDNATASSGFLHSFGPLRRIKLGRNVRAV